jgi:hypothetical protein
LLSIPGDYGGAFATCVGVRLASASLEFRGFDQIDVLAFGAGR